MIGTLSINGVIGEIPKEDGSIMTPFTTIQSVINQVESQRGATHFDVHIKSPGGYVEDGNEIFDYLTSLKKNGITIHTHVDEMCASIATKILLAGTRRFAKKDPAPELMIHNPFGQPNEGDADYMEAYYKSMRSLENEMINFYSEVTGSAKESIKPLMKKETFLSLEEAMTLGFITDIVEKVELKAVALLKPKNPNKMADKLVTKEEVESMFDKFSKSLAKMFKGKAKNILLQDADGTEIDFPDVEEGQSPAVADKATIDGSAAEGTYTMPNGDVFVFVAGVVESITPKADEGDDAELETLKTTAAEQAAEIANLKKEIKAVKKEKEDMIDQAKALKADFEKIKALAGEFEIDGKKKDTRKKTEGTKRSL